MRICKGSPSFVLFGAPAYSPLKTGTQRFFPDDLCESNIRSTTAVLSYRLRRSEESGNDFSTESKSFGSLTGLDLGMRLSCGQAYPRLTIEGMEAMLRNEREGSRFQAWNREPRQLGGSRPVHISDLCMLDTNITYSKWKINSKICQAFRPQLGLTSQRADHRHRSAGRC